MQKTLKKYFVIFTVPTLIAFSFAFIIPFVQGLYLSFCKFSTVDNAQWVGFSNFAHVFTDESFGVSIEGLKYSLCDARLTNDIPLGVSNSGDGAPAKITVKRGALYVLWEDPQV